MIIVGSIISDVEVILLYPEYNIYENYLNIL